MSATQALAHVWEEAQNLAGCSNVTLSPHDPKQVFLPLLGCSWDLASSCLDPDRDSKGVSFCSHAP